MQAILTITLNRGEFETLVSVQNEGDESDIRAGDLTVGVSAESAPGASVNGSESFPSRHFVPDDATSRRTTSTRDRARIRLG